MLAMNKVSGWIELLGGWCLGRRPRTSDTRHMIGSWAAKAMLAFLVFEWVIQLGWLGFGQYSYLTNYVSDLGAIRCHVLQNPDRYVCSPSSAVMDLALVFIGVSVVVSACLITSPVLWVAAHPGDLDQTYRPLRRAAPNGKFRYQPTRFARVMTIIVRWSLAMAGLAIFTIGTFPEDYIPSVHVTAVIILCAAIIAFLSSVGILWFKRTNWSLSFFGLTFIASLSGLAMLLRASGLYGLIERGVIYPFVVGIAILGFKISVAAHHERAGGLQPRAAGDVPWVLRMPAKRVAKSVDLSGQPVAIPVDETTTLPADG